MPNIVLIMTNAVDRLERYIHNIVIEEVEMFIILNEDLNARRGLEKDFILDDSSALFDTVVNSFGKRRIDL